MIKRWIAVLLVATSCLGAAPRGQAATVWSGACLVNVTLSFGTTKARLNSDELPTFDLSSPSVNNTCAISDGAVPGTGTPKIWLSGPGGSGLAGTCVAADGGGTFEAGFTGTPTPPSFGGSWGFDGGIEGGLLTLDGTTSSNSMVVAYAALVPSTAVTGETTCASMATNTGITSIQLTGLLVINDPSLD